MSKSKTFKKVFGDGKMTVKSDWKPRIPVAPPGYAFQGKRWKKRGKLKEETRKLTDEF